MTYPLGPSGQPGLARNIKAAVPDSAIMRIGRVTRYSAGSITVAISDSDVLVDASYIFAAYQPCLGDIVQVTKQGNQWVVQGALSANPEDNPILNYSFEDGAVGGGTPNWSIYHDPLSTDTTTITVDTVSPSPAIDGPQALKIQLGASVVGAISTSVDYVSSAPFPVVPGQRWAAQAWFLGQSFSSGPWVRGTAAIFFSFYNNPADTYPNTAAGDDGFGQVYVPSTPPWLLLRTESGSGTGAEVPAGISHARVTLETVLTHENATSNYGLDVFWDRIIATKLSG
jgi:hypothetical protein